MTKFENSPMPKLTDLKKKRNQIDAGCAIIEGDRLLRQLIANNVPILDIFCWQEQTHPSWLSDFRPKLISKKKFSALAQTKTPQNYIAIAKRSTAKIGDYQTLLYLDKIADPGNLGTIARTALALGVDGIALSPDSCDAFNPKAIRSSLGAVFSLPIETKNYQWLKEQKAQKILADLCGTSIYRLPPLQKKKILIMGSEASGASKEAKSLAELTITIPLTSKMESLNLAIATGICLSHI